MLCYDIYNCQKICLTTPCLKGKSAHEVICQNMFVYADMTNNPNIMTENTNVIDNNGRETDNNSKYSK